MATVRFEYTTNNEISAIDFEKSKVSFTEFTNFFTYCLFGEYQSDGHFDCQNIQDFHHNLLHSMICFLHWTGSFQHTECFQSHENTPHLHCQNEDRAYEGF